MHADAPDVEVGPMFEPFNAQGEVKDKQVVNQRKVKTATAGFES